MNKSIVNNFLLLFKFCLIVGDFSWQEDKSDIDALSSTQFVYNPNHSMAINIQRQRLPIFENRNHLIYLLEKYQTVILVGETGCGKSTQVGQVKTKIIIQTNKITSKNKEKPKQRNQNKKLKLLFLLFCYSI